MIPSLVTPRTLRSSPRVFPCFFQLIFMLTASTVDNAHCSSVSHCLPPLPRPGARGAGPYLLCAKYFEFSQEKSDQRRSLCDSHPPSYLPCPTSLCFSFGGRWGLGRVSGQQEGDQGEVVLSSLLWGTRLGPLSWGRVNESLLPWDQGVLLLGW